MDGILHLTFRGSKKKYCKGKKEVSRDFKKIVTSPKEKKNSISTTTPQSSILEDLLCNWAEAMVQPHPHKKNPI